MLRVGVFVTFPGNCSILNEILSKCSDRRPFSYFSDKIANTLGMCFLRSDYNFFFLPLY